MKFNRSSHTRILDDLTLTFDPTGSTVELGIERADGTVDWYSAAWLDTPVQGVDRTGQPFWEQTAQTTVYFAGPNGDPTSATVLTEGRHITQSRVTKGQDVIVCASSPIDVG